MFTYESIVDDNYVELYIHSRAMLDREEQESYKFKVDLLDKNGNTVEPSPVWYSEFTVMDQNDNAPTIADDSKIHSMEENTKVGDMLPNNNYMNNKENGRLVILDADKEGTDSMQVWLAFSNYTSHWK